LSRVLGPVVLVMTLFFLPSAMAQPITIGTLDSAQEQVLGCLLGVYLQEHGFQVEYKTELSSVTRWRALGDGEMDLVWEDPQVVWFLKYFEVEVLPEEELYRQVRERDREEELIWLGRADLLQPYVLVMRAEEAEELGIGCISDLVHLCGQPSDLKMAMEDEFFIRPDGYGALKRAYGLSLPRSRIVTTFPGMALGLLSQGEIDVAVVPSTEPLLAQEGLRMLVDDKGALPTSRLGIVAREEVVSAHPKLPELIQGFWALVPTAAELGALSLRLHEGEDPEDVAADYLETKPQERG
jgi:osmoprotectant transport system substrate-binding protein